MISVWRKLSAIETFQHQHDRMLNSILAALQTAHWNFQKVSLSLPRHFRNWWTLRTRS